MFACVRSGQNEYRFQFTDPARLRSLFGSLDINVQIIEDVFDVHIDLNEGELVVQGKEGNTGVSLAKEFIEEIIPFLERESTLNPNDLRKMARTYQETQDAWWNDITNQALLITEYNKKIRSKTKGQREYLRAVSESDIVFCIGPAGTGKTYLAMAMACAALQKKDVSRIVLVRPAVEAGESLGYLPGDLKEKIEPYLRPLYDALYEMLSPERFHRYCERGIIEVAPLAYMRGRTLNDSFIVLDEAQNTTPEQIKMFLTRMGFGSKVVVTGDITQIDLPSGKKSGLVVIQDILRDIGGIRFLYLTEKDVVRHPLVQKIILAYEKFEKTRELSS
ncbi:MAG TPA: PhoH family protein [Atribacteraceae bacterium]|nr:PhoH family protein [Atribacteraceae bacterium]